MFQWTFWDHYVGGFSVFVDIDSFSKRSKKTLFEIFK